MYTHSPDPSKQYAILRKIRGLRDQAIPGYFAPQIPWVQGCSSASCFRIIVGVAVIIGNSCCQWFPSQ